jgi:indolepyruvate ferredoxin oxidoreductase alpha subunit
VVNPRNSKKTKEAVKAAMAHKGLSVMISQEICPLYARRIGAAPKRPVYQVDTSKCKNHRDCLTKFACPAFYLEGEQVLINPDLCIGCAVCAQVCPEAAIRPVKQGG